MTMPGRSLVKALKAGVRGVLQIDPYSQVTRVPGRNHIELPVDRFEISVQETESWAG